MRVSDTQRRILNAHLRIGSAQQAGKVIGAATQET